MMEKQGDEQQDPAFMDKFQEALNQQQQHKKSSSQSQNIKDASLD